MKRYYLFGSPAVQHLVERVHVACFQQLGLTHSHKFVGAVSELQQCHRLLDEENFSGAVLAKPMQRSFPSVPKLGIANRLGTINTIVRQQGFLVAYNTDYAAISHCLDSYSGIKSAAVLGTGSLANTMLHYLLRRNIAVSMVCQGKNYNHSKNSESLKYLKWLEQNSTSPDLVVSTSAENSDIDLEPFLMKRPIVMDVNPEQPNIQLLKEASHMGCSQLITSTEFLIHRTLEHNYLFTGHMLNTEGNRQSLLREFLYAKESARGS